MTTALASLVIAIAVLGAWTLAIFKVKRRFMPPLSVVGLPLNELKSEFQNQ
jgi:hypothetical protein